MLALSRRNLFDLFDDFARDYTPRALTPAADVYSDAEKVVVEIELPGINPEAVDVSVHGNTLTVKGEKRYEKKKSDYESLERYYGSFTRSFSLPSTVNPDGIEASSSNGILTIMIPKQEKALPRKVKVLPGK